MLTPKRKLNLFEYETTGEADKALAKAIAEAMLEGYSKREKAVLSLSGGRSPVGMMRALSFAFAPWPAATILLVDDRETDKWATPRSNAGLIQNTFADTPASMANFVPPVPEGARVASLDKVGAAPELVTLLKQGSDALVLGMGEDGHFASLFPEADRLEEAFDPNAVPGVLPISAPGADEPRVTQNFAAINKSRALFLQLPNPQKLAIFNDILEGRMTGTPMARFLESAGPDLNIYTVTR